MSAASIDDLESATTQPSRFAHPLMMLALLAACHFLVDIVAGTTSPLWPTLESRLRFDEGGLLWVSFIWSISTSFSQLFFGLWADRYHGRWLIWVGPLIGILCISSVGLVSSSVALAVLFAIGGLGIAAFHPEAAATAGALLPDQRSRAMAIFALSGYMGQAVGPAYSGKVVDELGLPGLVWGMAWGLPILFILFLGLRRVPVGASSSDIKTSDEFKPRVKLSLIVLLLAVGALRILPALGVPLALAYLLKSAEASNSVIGAVQSAFMGGIGFGAMACAAFVKRRWERNVLWIFPLCTAPFLAAITFASDWTLVGLVGTSGLLLGVTMPVYISYGQQLLPHGQRVASAITMGVSWGIGGGISNGSLWICIHYDSLPMIFGFFSLAALASSLLCYFLPAPDESAAVA